MAFLNGVALAVIRFSYGSMIGPDPDPLGVYKHYFIDLFGMVVHLLLAAGVVTLFQRLAKSQPKPNFDSKRKTSS